MRYWLAGREAGKVEVFANLAGYPDNVRANGRGGFWVAIDCCRTPTADFLSRNPWRYLAVPVLEHLQDGRRRRCPPSPLHRLSLRRHSSLLLPSLGSLQLAASSP